VALSANTTFVKCQHLTKLLVMCFCHGINQVSIPGATVRNIERQPFSITMPAQAPQTVARLTVTFDRVPRGGSASFYQPPPMLIDHEVYVLLI